MGALKHGSGSDTQVSGGPSTIADYINARAKADGLSQRTIATNTGYSRSRVNRILRDEDRRPISLKEANGILASMGVGHLEVALANEVIEKDAGINTDEMGIVLSLIAVMVDGLPTKIASLLVLIDGFESSDIRKEHGIRIHNAIYDMLKVLYTDLTERKDERLDFTKF